MGDVNIKYFYMINNVKYIRDNIIIFKNDEGIWIENQEDFKNMVLDYFEIMFIIRYVCYNRIRNFESKIKLDSQVQEVLRVSIFNSEVKEVFFQFVFFK